MREPGQKTPLRFRWDHRHGLHRRSVKIANSGLARLPNGPKYALTRRLRDGKVPYSLVRPGDSVIQVGAPADTVLSGRARGMHLALRAAPGKAIIVEPDPRSAEIFRQVARDLNLRNVTVVNSGAWFEPSTLNLLVDDTHPATNFVDGTVDYSEERRSDFTSVTVPANTLDGIVADSIPAATMPKIRVLSVTTNNSEREILRGIQGLIDAGLEYLCLARTGDGYDELASSLGFKLVAQDDRGFTYARASHVPPAPRR